MIDEITHYEAALLAEFVGTHISAFTTFCAKQPDISAPSMLADTIVNKLADFADESNK